MFDKARTGGWISRVLALVAAMALVVGLVPMTAMAYDTTIEGDGEAGISLTTVVPELASITVTPPTKTQYNVGEELDTRGMVVYANYIGEPQEEVTNAVTLSGFDSSSVGIVTVTVSYTEGNITKTATFDVTIVEPVLITYRISVSADPTEGGTVTGGGYYEQNASVTVTATANEHYSFVRWMEGSREVSTSASYTFTATAYRTLVAVFEEDGMINTVAAPTFSPEAGEVTSGTDITLSCETEGATILYDIGGSNDPSTEYTGPIRITETTTISAIAIREDMSPSDVVTATYTIQAPASETYTVTFKAAGGTWTDGTIADKQVTVEKGSAATAPAAPTREGFTFDGWDKDFGNVASDLTVAAKWKESITPLEPIKTAIPVGKALTYNGASQIGVAAGTGYTLSGTTYARDAGSYQATATLDEGYAWTDGTTATKTISWKINKAIVSVQAPTGKKLAYNGKKQTGVASGGRYTLSGTVGAKKIGSYTAKATLKTDANRTYTWTDGTTATKTIKWEIQKAANPLKIAAKTATVKSNAMKEKAQTLARKKVITITKKGQGKMTYKKVSGNKKITINKKTGKVTLKKGLKKGTYKVKVKVKAAGNSNYKASAWKKVTFKVIVK